MKRTEIPSDINPLKKQKLNPEDEATAKLGDKEVETIPSTAETRCYHIEVLPIELIKEIFTRCCTAASSICDLSETYKYIWQLDNLSKTNKYLRMLINQYIVETLTQNSNLKSHYNPFKKELLPDFENANYKAPITFYQCSLYNPRDSACARYKEIFEYELKSYIDLWSNYKFSFSKADNTYQLSIASGKTINFNTDNNEEAFILQKFWERYFLSNKFIHNFREPHNIELLDFISKYKKMTFYNLVNDLIFRLHQQMENERADYVHLKLYIRLVQKKLMPKAQAIELIDVIINKLRSSQNMKFNYYLLGFLHNLLGDNLIKKLNDEDANFLIDLVITILKDTQAHKFHEITFVYLEMLFRKNPVKLNDEDASLLKNFSITKLKHSDEKILPPAIFMFWNKPINYSLIELNGKNASFLKELRNLAIIKLNDTQDQALHCESLSCLLTLIRKNLVKLNDKNAIFLKNFVITKLKDSQNQKLLIASLHCLSILIRIKQSKLNYNDTCFLHYFANKTLMNPQAQVLHNDTLILLSELIYMKLIKLDNEFINFLKNFATTNLQDAKKQEFHDYSLALLSILIQRNLIELKDEDSDFLKNFAITNLKKPMANINTRLISLLFATAIAKTKEELFPLVSLEVFETFHENILRYTNLQAPNYLFECFGHFLNHPEEKIRSLAAEIYVMGGSILPKNAPQSDSI